MFFYLFSCIQLFLHLYFRQKQPVKNFAIFTGKRLYWSLFLIKLQAFRPATSVKGDSTQVFSCQNGKIKKKTILKNIWEHLLQFHGPDFGTHSFPGPGFSGSDFFRVQVYLSPRFSASESMVRIQVLEVAISNIDYGLRKTNRFLLI